MAARAEACRRCGATLVYSLVDVLHCAHCAKQDRGEIDRLVAYGVTLANRAHIALLEAAEEA